MPRTFVARPAVDGQGSDSDGIYKLDELLGLLEARLHADLARHGYAGLGEHGAEDGSNLVRVVEEGGAHPALDGELLRTAHVHVERGDVVLAARKR